MPWRETKPMDQKKEFVRELRRGLYSMTELAERYGVSRKTGYALEHRVAEFGLAGLAPQSRRPHTSPNRTPDHIAALLIAAKLKHPAWGPGMLLDWLRPRHREIRHWPAVSTAGAILKREGLVKPRRKRSPRTHPGVVDPITDVPNDLWTADFKGQFRTQDHIYCYPLTIADQHTRFLLACHGLTSVKGEEARPVFERTFREYGLPRAIRTDNGAPFVTRALCGLSHLNVWWMRLGIQHQRIRPASPQENGAHERMHRTLKREAIRPPKATMRSQQRAFDDFRTEYNAERPHTHHGGKPPSTQYAASPREYPSKLPALEYPGHYTVKRVTTVGTFRFKTKLLFIANALRGYHIGLDEETDGVWSIFFGDVLLAKLDERDYIIRE